MKHSKNILKVIVAVWLGVSSFSAHADVDKVSDDLIEQAWACDPTLNINFIKDGFVNSSYFVLAPNKDDSPGAVEKQIEDFSNKILTFGKCSDQNNLKEIRSAFITSYVSFSSDDYSSIQFEYDRLKNCIASGNSRGSFGVGGCSIKSAELKKSYWGRKNLEAKAAEERTLGYKYMNCETKSISKASLDILGNQLGTPCSISQDLLSSLGWRYEGNGQFDSSISNSPVNGTLLDQMNKVNITIRRDEQPQSDFYHGKFAMYESSPYQEYKILVLLDKYERNKDVMHVFQFDHLFCAVDGTNSLHGENSFKRSLIDKYGKPTYEMTIPQLRKDAKFKDRQTYYTEDEKKYAGKVVMLGWVNKKETLVIFENTHEFSCGILPKFKMTIWDVSSGENFVNKFSLNRKRYLDEHSNRAAVPAF